MLCLYFKLPFFLITENSGLEVRGTLLAEGQAPDDIVFTSLDHFESIQSGTAFTPVFNKVIAEVLKSDLEVGIVLNSVTTVSGSAPGSWD